uniref:DUF834 domain-containing protein n=1 Tax=Oryza punctata TaxID=4537 RepID=A0A0E0LL57_ORYPU
MASLHPAPREVLEEAWGRRGTRRALPLDLEAASSAAAAGNGLGALLRGCGINGWRRWTGLEPSMGVEANGKQGDSEEDEGSAAASGAVLGSETELGEVNSPEGGPTRGSGGIGRSSGDPGRRCEVTEGHGSSDCGGDGESIGGGERGECDG